MLLVTVSAAVTVAYSQSKSPVFRDYQEPRQIRWAPSQLPGIGKQVYQFNLVRRANNGEAEAQNDLGLRYLLGDGFEVDTITAVSWIRKAAAQNLYAAHYNMGLLYNMGAGMPWDPFKAFLHFRYAADNDEPNAQYAFALMFTDNLVVERNWLTSYQWLRRARENGVQRAEDVINELLAKGYITPSDTLDTPHENAPILPAETGDAIQNESGWAPVFLDFDRDTIDSSVDIEILLVEAMETGNYDDEDSLRLAEWLQGGPLPDSAVGRVATASFAGNPEATVFLGKAAETGLSPEHGVLYAMQQYIHGIYQDAWRAGSLLNQALQNYDIQKLLTRRSFENDSVAMFVWAGLKRLNIDKRLNETQALELLTMSAEGGNLFAKVQLGMCYASGIWVDRDLVSADSIWNDAANRGCVEAESRIAAQTVLEHRVVDYTRQLNELEDASESGSLLATVALAYAWQSGTGYEQNLMNAVHFYRRAAVRGSRNAHEALQALYDAHRPDDWDQGVAGEIKPPER